MTVSVRSLRASVPDWIAGLIGITIPALVFGRTALAVAAGLAFILCFFLPDWQRHWRSVGNEARRPVGVLIVIALVCWLPGGLSSSDPVRSVEAIARTGAFVAIAVLLWSILKSDARAGEGARKALIAGSLIAVVVALLSLTLLPQLYWFTHLHGWRADPIRTELKSFAALSVLLIPLLLLVSTRLSATWRAAALFGAAGLLLMVVMTDNRAAVAGLLATAAASAIAVAVRITDRRRLFILAAIVVAAFAAILLWLFVERSHLKEIAPDQDWLLPVWLIDFERQTIWAHTWKLASTAPFFGLGVNTVNFSPGAEAVIPGTDNLHLIPGHPHNWLLEVLAETGIVGLFPMIVAIIATFFRWLLAFRRTADLANLTAIAIAAGYWGSGLFNFSFWSAWWQVSFVVALALCHVAGAPPAPAAGSRES